MHYRKRHIDPNAGGNTIANAVHSMLHPGRLANSAPASPSASCASSPRSSATGSDPVLQQTRARTRPSSPWTSLKRWAGVRSNAQQLDLHTSGGVDRAALLKAQGELAAGIFAEAAAQAKACAHFGLRWEEEVGVAGRVTELDAARDDRWMLLPHEAAAALRRREDLSWAEAHRRLASNGARVESRESLRSLHV